MKGLVGDIQHSQRYNNIPLMGIDGQLYSFCFLFHVAEAYKVTSRAFLEITCHREGLQTCFCSAVPEEGKEVAKFILL